jgi:hypothetical protein
MACRLLQAELQALHETLGGIIAGLGVMYSSLVENGPPIWGRENKMRGMRGIKREPTSPKKKIKGAASNLNG